MTARRLSYLVRTSKGVVVLGPLAAAFGYAIASDLSAWRGDWWWGFNNFTQGMPIAILLTAFVAGWDSGALHSGFNALRDRRPASQWRIHATLLAVPLGLVWLLYFIGALIVAVITLAASGSVDPRAPMVICAHLAMLALAACVGSFAGRFTASPYAAFAAAATMAALVFWDPPWGEHIFAFPGAASPIIGGTPSGEFFWPVVLGGLVAALCLVLSSSFRRASRAVSIGGGLAALASVGFASWVAHPYQFESSNNTATRCADRGVVTVCVFPGYDRLLGRTADRLNNFLAAAASAGVPASSFPSRFEQYGGTRFTTGTGVLELGMNSLEDRTLDSDALAGSVSTPLWCPQMFAEEPPLSLLDHRQAVYDWALLVDGAMPAAEYNARYPRAEGLSRAKQADQIARHLTALRECATR